MDDSLLKNAKFLLVDDEQYNIELLEAVLNKGGFSQISSTTDPRRVLPLFIEYKPDILVLDFNMPNMNGLEVIRQVVPRVPAESYFPILVITSEMAPEIKHNVLSAGAKDFLSKPIDKTEVLLRVRNLLTTRVLYNQLEHQNERLEVMVRQRTQELDLAQEEILERLGRAAEYRDDETGQHTRRIGRSAALVAEIMGWTMAQLELMRRAAPLHDIGKIGIADRILLKPAKLTAEEFEAMKEHVTIGSKTLMGSRSPLLQLAETIALTHHERWDGSGYLKLKKEEIPLAGRIVSVADVFDALTHKRPYKEAWPIDRTREEMASKSGQHFDPQVLEAFFKLLDREGERLLTLN
ncbi:MAG: two-component system response regulator [Nitrospirae bacterium RIFCSPLOWO2_02_FULL_62_14]|nr:MAG: two-component system response regulator [Nitrospirae bacterium RIFCSPLOWO2_02_FULL_62_14]